MNVYRGTEVKICLFLELDGRLLEPLLHQEPEDDRKDIVSLELMVFIHFCFFHLFFDVILIGIRTNLF